MHLKLSFSIKFIISSVLMSMFVVKTSRTAIPEKPLWTYNQERDMYAELDLESIGLSRNVYDIALRGYKKLLPELSKPFLSIVDFTQSSNQKRLYIIDMDKGELLYNSYVAHGKNTGEEYAREFSNNPESHQSSLGFYLTSAVYTGKHGLSLKLRGLEEGFNSNAEQRAIVLHGAEYVSEDFIKKHGRLGRSYGCPAVACEEATPIISTIKEGSCLYLHFPDPDYAESSFFAGIPVN